MPPVASAEPRLTARGRATRDRVVVAAAALIHARGVAGTSLDDVRAATDTSKSQLYHYFADKSTLVRAVIERQVEQVLLAQSPTLTSISSWATLRRWADQLIALNEQAHCAGGCPLGRLASELAEADPAARAALQAGFARWQAALAQGLAAMRQRGELRADADVDVLALGLLAAVQGGLLLAQTARSVVPLAVALDHALAGLAAAAGCSDAEVSG